MDQRESKKNGNPCAKCGAESLGGVQFHRVGCPTAEAESVRTIAEQLEHFEMPLTEADAEKKLDSLEDIRADLKRLFLRSIVFHDLEWQRDAFALLLELRFRRFKVELPVAIVGGDPAEIAKVKAARDRARGMIDALEAEGALLHDVVFR